MHTIITKIRKIETEMWRPSVEELFANPRHPYTKALLSAILLPKVGGNPEFIPIRGEVTSPIDLPDECSFFDRCDYACPECKQGTPPLTEISPGHFVACFLNAVM